MQLIITEQILSVQDKYTACDAVSGAMVYEVKSTGKDVFYYRHRVYDDKGNALLVIKKKTFSFLPTYYIRDNDGKLVALVKKKFGINAGLNVTCEQGNMELKGNYFGWDYEIKKDGVKIGDISKKLINVADKYAVNIEKPEDAPLCIALIFAVNKIFHTGDTAKNKSLLGFFR